jgi:hypothetical protein
LQESWVRVEVSCVLGFPILAAHDSLDGEIRYRGRP